MNNNQIDWSSFMVDDGLSLEEEINHSLAMSEYLIKSPKSSDVLSTEKRTLIFDLSTISFENPIEFKIPLNSNDLFNIFSKTEYELINPKIYFPRTKSLDNAFSLLFNLSKLTKIDTHTHIKFKNFTAQNRSYLDSLLYFGFLIEHGDNDFFITQHLKNTNSLEIDHMFIFFLKRIASSKSLNNILKLLLSTESFDSINRSMIKDDLLADRSIIEEQIDRRELDLIIRNMRLWYLAIRQKLII